MELNATYDAIAAGFSATRPRLRLETASLLPKLSQKSQVLDLGCGNGVLLSALPKNTGYLGIDFSNQLIQDAISKHPHNKFVLGDITKSETWSNLGKFDFIAALAVLHHLPDHRSQQFVLKQIKNHLKPEGVCLISIWRLWKLKYLRYHTSVHHLLIPFHNGPRRFFYAFFPGELESLCRQVGLSVDAITKTSKNSYFGIYNHKI